MRPGYTRQASFLKHEMVSTCRDEVMATVGLHDPRELSLLDEDVEGPLFVEPAPRTWSLGDRIDHYQARSGDADVISAPREGIAEAVVVLPGVAVLELHPDFDRRSAATTLR